MCMGDYSFDVKVNEDWVCNVVHMPDAFVPPGNKQMSGVFGSSFSFFTLGNKHTCLVMISMHVYGEIVGGSCNWNECSDYSCIMCIVSLRSGNQK